MTTKSESLVSTSERDVEYISEALKNSTVDDALHFLPGYEHAITYSDGVEKILGRKIDWMILPLLSLVAFLQFLDKSLRRLLISGPPFTSAGIILSS